MDFEGLFWIALIVFYFMSRVLGGKKKPSPRPTGGRPSKPDRSPRTSQEPELDDALREIRQALGFPVEEAEHKPEPSSEPEPEPASDLRNARARRTVEMERQRERDARELSRQQEMLERAQKADKKPPTTIPKPKVARRPGPIGAHPMESTFAEEEAFEGTGRHPHQQPPPDHALQAPYAIPSRQRENLKRRLRGKESLREAFVLKEVLDKPLALRGRR